MMPAITGLEAEVKRAIEVVCLTSTCMEIYHGEKHSN